MLPKVNDNFFVGQSLYVGIDVHKKNWKVTILGEHYEHKTMTQNPDPDLLVNYLKRNFPGGHYHSVYEAGFSGFEPCRKLKDLGVDCLVIHPADVPSNQKERMQKTDKADSRKLARALLNKELKGVHIPERSLEIDRALVRQRYRLMKDISRTKNRIKSLLFQFGINIPDRFTDGQTRHWSKVYLNWLKEVALGEPTLQQIFNNYLRTGEALRKELLEINQQVRRMAQEERYHKLCDLLISVPGIGSMSAMIILTQLGEIVRFKTLDQLCSYIGLVPSMHSSGDRVQVGKLINRGRKELKILLIEASWVAVRKDPALMAKFNDLVKSMPKNKAIIRIARKLISRIRHTLQTQQKYELGVVK